MFSSTRKEIITVLVLMVALMLVACSNTSADSNGTADTDVTFSAVEVQAGTPDEICDSATPAQEPSTRSFDEPDQVLEAGLDYRAVFCTEAGAIYIDLYEQYTPVTVNNFVFLSQAGYYNNTTFHRVIQDFMAQAGDPTGTGTGGPGYTFDDEPIGFLTFDRPGLLAMANTGQPVSNGSQFFFTTSEPSHLNFRHTIFGDVLVGQDVVENIDLRDPQSATQTGTSLDTIVIITDPELVVADIADMEPATIDDARTVISEFPDIGLPTVEALTGVFTTDTLSDLISVEDISAIDVVFADNNYQFSVSAGHINDTCNLVDVGVIDIAYILHAFTTSDDALTVIESDIISDLLGVTNESSTLESEDLPYPISIEDVTACEASAVPAVTYWQRGRFIAVISITVPEAESENLSGWLNQVIGRQIYEQFFADLLRPEIRSN